MTKTRTWFRIHSFTGIITGLLLFVICWSGTIATISHEIDWLVTPEARAQPGSVKKSWGDMTAAVQTAYPDAEILSVMAPLYDRSSAIVLVNLPDQRLVRIYVDPYSGQINGRYSYLNVQRFFRSFHRSIFLPTGIGTIFVSLFSVTMLASLVAALYFYKRWWTRFFRFKNGTGRLFWSELHKSAGLWSIWFIVVIGATGVWYGFERLRFDIGDGIISYVGPADVSVREFPKARTQPGGSDLPLDRLLEKVRTARPDLDIKSVRLRKHVLSAHGQAGHFLVRDRANQIALDARSGEVLYNHAASDLPPYWRWSDTADPLHFGDFGGLASKLVWFFFGLVLSGLILTGTWLHAHRLARDRPRARWPGTAAACVVSLIVIAASAPLGIQGARESLGPTIEGVKHLPTLAPGVKYVIFGWIALTLAIIASWMFLLWRPQTVLRKPESDQAPVRMGRAAANRKGR